MAEGSLNHPHLFSPSKANRPSVSWDWPRLLGRVFLGLALLTLGLMALGSATRVMNAGLACPDWPLCYGAVVPRQQMNLQVFLEWFHRLVASSLGALVLVLTGTVWGLRQRLPRWLPWATTSSLGLVVFQGVLGGLTVTELLRFDIVTAHLATGLLFFCSLLAIAASLWPYQGTGVVGKLHWVGLGAATLVYLQNILGALVASQWAVHQCRQGMGLCQVMYSHLAGVVPATLSVGILIWMAWRVAALHPLLRRCAQGAGGLLILQALLGTLTLRLQLQVPTLTVAHQMVGATLLGTLVVFSVIAARDRRQAQYILAIPQTTVPEESVNV
ncbi:heme A synthase [Synechococcales cyanobacterium C]|uniref:Heme A synthase n=1 Tax=Petrachloros mirabilis ULC683 TaxID=2781853 RepID=A0A8K2A146_9CYAN|nr:heme A synthase [Petrachloros mirabilis]NCJ07846.1 heme A synthase [Petrachloros mirabilis ULC683]